MKNYRHYQGKRPVKRVLTAILALFLASVVAFGVLLGLVLSGGHDKVQGDPQIMVILGCQVKP